MVIYADKRDCKLTGLWRVELQRGPQRYRGKRVESHREAQEDEKRVLAL